MEEYGKSQAGLGLKLAELRRRVAELEVRAGERTEPVCHKAVQSEQMLSAVIHSMTVFLETGSWQKATAVLLNAALQETGSEYGFAGVVVEQDGKQVLRILSHQGIVWDENRGRDLYDGALRTYRELGYLTFTGFDNLFGSAIRSKAAVVANDPANDPRAGGIPEGHPPLKHFLGVPVLREGTVVGMIGIANRPGGYGTAEQDQIELLVQAAGVLYDSYRRQEREAVLDARQKQMEADARGSEKALRLFRALVDQSNDAIEVLDPETGRFLDVNERGCSDLGYTREEFLALSVFDIDPLVDEASFREAVDETGRSGSLLWQGVHRRKDGTTFSVEVGLRSVHLDRHYLVAVARDTTERLQTEQLLRRTAERLQLTLDNLPLVAYEIDAEGRWVMSRGKGLEALGRLPDEVVGQSLFAFYRDKPAVTGAVRKALGGEPQQIEIEIGGRNWLANYQPLTGDSGKVERVFGTAVDITERKTAEEEVRESEARLRDLIESIPEGVCLLDDVHRVVLTNRAAREYLAALSGNPLEDQITRIGDFSVDEVLARSDGKCPLEVTAAGSPTRIFEVVAPPTRAGSEAAARVVVIREVTEERKLQDRMQQQYRLAAVGQLAAGIAHDFNNLLTVMMGTSQIAEAQEDLPERLRDDLKTIYSQGQRAAQLVRQVLDFSRETVIDRHPLDILPFLKESAKLLSRTLPETIQVVADLTAAECVVNTNPTQLQQVLTNLSVNARDAMSAGGTMGIGLSRVSIGPDAAAPMPDMKPGDWAVWTVSDTGTGMPADVMSRMFEPFYTTKPLGQGTGLGLSQVYGIVKQHNGEIDVKSEVGRGTTFTIYLPLTPAKAVEHRPASGDIPRGAGETVLAVEDDPAILRLVSAFLETLNYRVLTAGDGMEALQSYEQHRGEVALVLSDLVMPRMGGSELLEALLGKDPEVRVVLMSGYAPGHGAAPRLPEGIVGFLEKPLTLESLARVVGHALSKLPE